MRQTCNSQCTKAGERDSKSCCAEFDSLGSCQLGVVVPQQEIPLEDVLVENSTYTTSSRLKARLLKAGRLKEECSSCGNGPEWNGKPLSLQLDHINGINNDNRIENLRILCPNCHSQTDTYSGKNAKKLEDEKVKHFCKCGAKVHRRGISCHPCTHGKGQYPVSKEVLLAFRETLTWNEIGKLHDVSGNAVRKWAKAYGIL